ncbi:Ger(x)C family spore germination protein [Alkalihalobacterium elongatum]|uniref:Ger(x)C family spore germination protein n=1 Tax=Alkalihalobacterium elongatum TaxID=2675466 RepID=UPI001C1F747C|nr:Ger(x)C family spore germination protein [Alkalihalobacterium elongatum]
MKKFLILFLTVFLLTSCINAKQLERMYYIHVIGIDYVDGLYVAYAQLLNFATIARGEAGGGGGEQHEAIVGKGVGETVDTAVHNLYHSTAQRIFWGHLAAVVLSDAAIEQEIAESLDLLLRYHEIRYTLWLFTTNEPLEDLLATFPVLEASPVLGTLGNPTDSYAQSSFIPPIRMHRFISDLNEPGKTAFAPHLTIDKEQWFDGKELFPAIHMDGVSLLTNKKYKGTLTDLDVVGFRWLQDTTERAPIVINHKGEPASVVMMENPDAQITPIVEGSSVQFDIEVEVKGNVIQMMDSVSLELIEEQAQQVIENEIRKTFEKGLEIYADIYRLSYAFYQNNPEVWRKLTENEELPLTKESLKDITVKVKIHNAGKNKLRPLQ